MSFVHLHCHSEYSLLDGANRIEDLIKRALEFEQPALAITDHGNLHAAWEFQEKANKSIIPQARDRQMVSQVNVVGVGVMDAHRSLGSVMVYINQTWIDKSRQPLYNGSRVKVDYQRLNGRWLINSIEVV